MRPTSVALLWACLVWSLWGCETSSASGTGSVPRDSSGLEVPADADPADPKVALDLSASCVRAINAHRAKISLGPLAHWTDSAACFARQAARDDQANKGHANFLMCEERAQNTCPNWLADQAAGGVEGAMERCLESMWNEGPGEDYAKHGHYINMTKTSYTKVGCGFHLQSGSVWINMDFR